jgi:hypothetical protein
MKVLKFISLIVCFLFLQSCSSENDDFELNNPQKPKNSINIFDAAILDFIEKTGANPENVHLFAVRSNRKDPLVLNPIPESYKFDATILEFPIHDNGFLDTNEKYPLNCLYSEFYEKDSTFQNFGEYQRPWVLKGGVIVDYDIISIEDTYTILKNSKYNDKPQENDFFFMETDNFLHDGTQELAYVFYYIPKDGSPGNVKITYVLKTGKIIKEVAKKSQYLSLM